MTSPPPLKRPGFYMIANIGTLLRSNYAQSYPCHLVLVEQVLGDSPAYVAQLEGMCASATYTVVLDNGAYEEKLASCDHIMTAAISIKPDIIVLPDLVGLSGRQSFEASCHDYEHLQGAIKQGDLPESTRFMWVGQGDSAIDTLECYRLLMTQCPDPKPILGLGRGYYHWCATSAEQATEEGRHRMMRDIDILMGNVFLETSQAPHPIMPDFDCFLLGARWYPSPILHMTTHLRVIGIDSYKPCRAAVHGYRYGTERCMSVQPPLKHTNRDLFANDFALADNVKAFCEAYNLAT